MRNLQSTSLWNRITTLTWVLKLLSYRVLPDFCKDVTFWKVPRFYPFVFLGRPSCGWRWILYVFVGRKCARCWNSQAFMCRVWGQCWLSNKCVRVDGNVQEKLEEVRLMPSAWDVPQDQTAMRNWRNPGDFFLFLYQRPAFPRHFFFQTENVRKWLLQKFGMKLSDHTVSPSVDCTNSIRASSCTASVTTIFSRRSLLYEVSCLCCTSYDKVIGTLSIRGK